MLGSGQKRLDNFADFIIGKSTVRKLFEGEMVLTKNTPKTLLQLFCKMIYNSQVIDISSLHPVSRQFLGKLLG